MADITSLSGSDSLSASRSTINTNFANSKSTYIGATAPASPVAGMLWLDNATATEVLKVYDGAAWRTLFPDAFSTSTGGGLLPLAGGTLTGNVSGGGTAKLTNLASGSSSGDSITYGQVTARIHTEVVQLGTLSASDNKYIAVAGTGTWTVSDCLIVSELGVTSDASNLWTFNVRNLTAGANLRSSAKSTNGAAITADTAYALGLDQNLTPSSGAVLQLQCTKTGSPNALTEAIAVLRYSIA